MVGGRFRRKKKSNKISQVQCRKEGVNSINTLVIITATLALELLSLHLPSEESTLFHRGYNSLLSAFCICMGMQFNSMIKIYKVQISNWKIKLDFKT